MHYVTHVVVAVDVGVTQHAVQVLIDGFNDDMGVAGKDGDEGALGEENPHLQRKRCIRTTGQNPGPGVSPCPSYLNAYHSN